MGRHQAITAAQLWDGSKLISNPVVEIEDGQIVALGSQAQLAVPTGADLLDFPNAILAPAFFDVHNHGGAGHDIMEATPESTKTVSRFLAGRGTGSYLATTVTAPLDTILRSLEGLAKRIREAQSDTQSGIWVGARPLGVHLEGPFLSHAKRGVHPPQHLLAPDIALFDRMYEASEGHIRLLTLAPELPEAAAFAAHAVAKGVRISVGHSNATAAETHAAIDAGATSATHTFNAMRPLDHREIGILGTVLTTDSLFAELICDGIHVHPSLVKLWWRAKGSKRGILITDAMSASGMPEGEYMLGEMTIQVVNGHATANGVLAGSVLTLDRALQNFVAYTGVTVESALPLLTHNPAAMTGFSDLAGSIRTGQPANLVALDPSGALIASIVQGRVSNPN